MRANLTEEWVELIWKHAILPYLGEQFFGEEERLAEFELERLRFGSSPRRARATMTPADEAA